MRPSDGGGGTPLSRGGRPLSAMQLRAYERKQSLSRASSPQRSTSEAGVGASAAPVPRADPAGRSRAVGRWQTAGRQVQIQNQTVRAFENNTGKRPSDANDDEWLYRDWPVWQCSKPILDLAQAKRRAKRMVFIYMALLGPISGVLGVLGLHVGSGACASDECEACRTATCVEALSDEKLECLDHTVSRVTRLTEMGVLWLTCGGCYALALWLEISSRSFLAKHIAKLKAQAQPGTNAGVLVSETCQARVSAGFRIGFLVTASLATTGYAIMWLYILGLSVLLHDVCDGNFGKLLLFIMLGWGWLLAMLFNGVPLACYTWLRWHGCNASDAKALLDPLKYPVPPIPKPPPARQTPPPLPTTSLAYEEGRRMAEEAKSTMAATNPQSTTATAHQNSSPLRLSRQQSPQRTPPPLSTARPLSAQRVRTKLRAITTLSGSQTAAPRPDAPVRARP